MVPNPENQETSKNHKKKKGGISRRKEKKSTQYTEVVLQKALNEVRAGESKKAVAFKYGIPRSTIQFRLSDKFTKIEKGRNTYLTKVEEKKLVEWIIENDRKGFPRRQLDLQLAVKFFLDADSRPNPFKNNLPGNHWYQLFIQRHPELSERTPEGVTSASATISEKDIKGWFTAIESYLKKKGLFSILSDPNRVYNGDETCFQFCPKLGKVIAPKGKKNVYEVDLGKSKENLTVMFTFSAAGDTTPPMIIYPNKRLPKNIIEGVPNSWGIGLSDNGWMKSQVFVDYIKNVFYPSIKEKVQFPIILFVDGHQTHLSLELSDICTKLEIILIALYPNATRLLQPADVASFKPLKTFWKNGVLNWRRNNPYCNLKKEHFAPILEKSLQYLKPSTIINGFKVCGLYPWNMNALDYSKCLGKKTEQAQIQLNNDPFKEFHNSVSQLFNTELITQLKENLPSNCSAEKCKYFNILQKMYDMLNTSNKAETFSVNEIANMPVIIDSQNDNSELEEVIILGNCLEEDRYKTPVKNVECLKPEPGKVIILENVLIEKESYRTQVENLEYLMPEPRTVLLRVDANCEINSGKSKTSDCAQNTVNTAYDSNNNDYSQYIEKENIDCFYSDNLENNNNTEKLNCDISSLMTKSEQDVLMSLLQTDFSPTKCDLPTIENFLTVPETPVRKGVKQTDRVSFVLTSSDYKTNMERKEKEKEEKERKKAENKQKRTLKAEERKINNTKQISKKPNNKTVVKKSKDSIRNKKITDGGINNDCLLYSPVPGTYTMISPTLQVSDDKIEYKKIPKPKYVRNLHHSLDDQQPFRPINNISVSKGICFSCTRNFALANIGIKCQKCSRAYHVNCLQKNNLYKEFFLCKVCTKQ